MPEMNDAQKQTMKDLLETQKIAKIGTWRLDLATNEVAWSEELYRMCGIDSGFPPPPYTEHMKLFSADSWQRLSSALNTTRTTGIPYELELETIKPDGSSGWMWVRAEAEKDASGNIVSIWGSAQDITTRKKIEQELKDSEERFQLLFNKAPLGYQSLDSDGYFLEVNQKWLDLLGYTKEEVIGKWFGDFLCPEYVDGFRKRFSIFKAQGYIHSEFEMRNKSGQKLFIAFDGKIGYDPHGKFKQTHCILQDITKQRAAEKALQDSEERYKCLFENSGVGIGYYTTDGHLISINKKALEFMGGKIEDYVGKSIRDFAPAAEADRYLERMNAALSTDDPQKYEDHLVLGCGPVWLVSTYSRVKNIAGDLIGIQITSLDVTDRKKAQQALFESQITIKAAFENNQAGILIADAPDGRLRYTNKAGLIIGNINEEELSNNINGAHYQDIWEILHYDGTPFDPADVPLIRALHSGEAFSEEMLIRRRGFEDRYVVSNAAPLRDATGEITASMVIMIDVTEKRQSEQIIRKQNELFSSLLKLLPVGVFMVDAADGKPLIVNEMAKTLLGRGIFPNTNKSNLSQVYQALKESTGEPYPPSEMPIILGMSGLSAHIDDMIVERPDGTRIQLEVFGSPVLNAEGHPWAGLTTFLNITERKKAENDLIYLSYHDSLTGLKNRRFYENELKRLDTADNLPFSVIMCDVNGLKLINDSFGHSSGDQFLMKAAETLQSACRPGDILARIGGDEFAVLLPKTHSEEALRIVKLMQQSASKIKIANIDLSISFGYETKTSNKQSLREVLANAENHMYRHKLYEHTSAKNKTIEIIMNTLFEKSNRESMHSNRVSSICYAIASKMNFDKDEVNKIRMAGLVHDIGKIGIHEDILNKPGKLTAEEREQINTHPEIGWRILSSSSELSELANFILNHHEKWDGTGYPNGTSGDKIPREARIIAVADSYDAMTSERTYRAALTREEAINELRRCSGTQFDAEIVAIFIEKVLPYEDFG